MIIDRGKRRGEIIIRPKLHIPLTSSLVWMHGLGDSAEGWLDVFGTSETFAPEGMRVRLLTAPMSPVTINSGFKTNSWYDITDLSTQDGRANQADIDRNSEDIQSILDEEAECHQGDISKVYIGGFSQGCAMAMHNSMLRNGSLGGVVGLSGYLPPLSKISPQNSPTLICHGDNDSVVFIEDAEQSYLRGGFLKRPNVEFHKIQYLQHSINQEVLGICRRFVLKTLKK